VIGPCVCTAAASSMDATYDLFDAAMGNREVRNDGLELAAERTVLRK